MIVNYDRHDFSFSECACDTSGSETNECDENGRCYECRPGFHGTKCDMCAMYYFGFPNCESKFESSILYSLD